MLGNSEAEEHIGEEISSHERHLEKWERFNETKVTCDIEHNIRGHFISLALTHYCVQKVIQISAQAKMPNEK